MFVQINRYYIAETKHESYMKKIVIIDGGPRRNMNSAGMLKGVTSIGQRTFRKPLMPERRW
jgi:hypothetical protein